jgi:crossover junction endonuclease EME1
MLQEVTGITPSAATGIAAEYPTFKDLMLAFERAEKRGGDVKGEGLLVDCEVSAFISAAGVAELTQNRSRI